jgi:hypothetical protein
VLAVGCGGTEVTRELSDSWWKWISVVAEEDGCTSSWKNC